MKSHWHRLCLPLLFVLTVAATAQTKAPAKPANTSSANSKVMDQARHAYYSLRGVGLDEFQSTIKPNWEVVLKDELKANPEGGQAALKMLNGLHFAMLLDKAGKVTVTHRADVEPVNAQQREGFNQIFSGMEQAVSGFFATWSLFMLNSPFPEAGVDYQLDDLGSQWRLSYKDGTGDVVTLMSKDLVISEVKVTTPEFVSSVRPTFNRTGIGFVLTGYAADYKPTSGPGVVKLDVKIDHQKIEGAQLPVSLIADSVLDGAPTHIELGFSEYQVKSH